MNLIHGQLCYRASYRAKYFFSLKVSMSVFVSANCNQKQMTVMRNSAFMMIAALKTQWYIYCEVCFTIKCDTIESHLK